MLLIAVFAQYFFGLTIGITSVFLVMLVLVQRGRGGGLTGALGGAGGQSAFGTKAGDLFTRITVAVASVWIALCAAAVFFLKDRELPDTGVDNRNRAAIASPLEPSGAAAAITPSNDAQPAPVVNEASGTSPVVIDAPAGSVPAGIAPPDSANAASPVVAPATEGTAPSDSPPTQPPAAEQSEPAAEQSQPAAATAESAADSNAATNDDTTPAEPTP